MWITQHYTAERIIKTKYKKTKVVNYRQRNDNLNILDTCTFLDCDQYINVTGISGTMINMPDMAYVSIFTENDLTHITEDHFEIKLIARLLDQMYVVQPPVFPPRYDDALPSAPQFPEHLHFLLTHS